MDGFKSQQAGAKWGVNNLAVVCQSDLCSVRQLPSKAEWVCLSLWSEPQSVSVEPFLRSVVPEPQLLSSWLSWEHPFILSQRGR